MKIVITEGRSLDIGLENQWEPYYEIGEVDLYDVLPYNKLIECAHDADVLISGKAPITSVELDQMSNLKYIGVPATGYDAIDVGEAAKRGIVVSNVPAYSGRSVAQHCAALLMALSRNVQGYDQEVQSGKWTNNDYFSYWKPGLIEFTGMTYAAIGMGDIGRKAARIMSAMGMNILAYRRNPKDIEDLPNIKWANSVEEVFENADVLSLHCPLCEDTEGIINKKSLSMMKQSAFLLNTARGKLVVEHDLADALNQGSIAGAGLDVLSTEPPKADNPLLTAKNCIITPHIGWISQSTLKELFDVVLGNLKAFVAGKPINKVN